MTNTARGNYIWIFISALFAVVAVVGIMYAVHLGNEAGALRDQVARQQDELTELRETPERPDALPREPLPPGTVFLSEWDIERMRQQGLENPIRDLRRDLMENPDLIPHEGILGGTMSFYMEDQIHVISPQWVVAYFEDGHITGQALLRYEVHPGGEIEWQVLDTHLDV